MPSPFRKDQLSPEMAQRYGLDRTPWGSAIIVTSVISAFALVLGWIGFSLSSGIKTRVLTWDDSAINHVTIEFEVQRDGDTVLASVRFSGLLREEAGATAEGIDEVWHVQHAWATRDGDWLIAGIQQMQG